MVPYPKWQEQLMHAKFGSRLNTVLSMIEGDGLSQIGKSSGVCRELKKRSDGVE